MATRETQRPFYQRSRGVKGREEDPRVRAVAPKACIGMTTPASIPDPVVVRGVEAAEAIGFVEATAEGAAAWGQASSLEPTRSWGEGDDAKASVGRGMYL